jgi:hypothetical protein
MLRLKTLQTGKEEIRRKRPEFESKLSRQNCETMNRSGPQKILGGWVRPVESPQRKMFIEA